MTAANVAHIFYEIPMGVGAKAMLNILEANTKKTGLSPGEVAIYINRTWSGVKILTHSTGSLYYRDTKGRALSVEEIRILPTIIGGPRLTFQKNLENALVKAYQTTFAKEIKRLEKLHA